MSKDNHEPNLKFTFDIERDGAWFTTNDLRMDDLRVAVEVFDLSVLKLLREKMSKADAFTFFFDALDSAERWRQEGK